MKQKTIERNIEHGQNKKTEYFLIEKYNLIRSSSWAIGQILSRDHDIQRYMYKACNNKMSFSGHPYSNG